MAPPATIRLGLQGNPRVKPPTSFPLARIAWIAAGFALVELVAGLAIGAFVARGRAEAAIFLAFRLWLAIGLALLVARWPPARRAAAYGAALLLATGSEALLVALLGGTGWVAAAARALAASAVLVVALDLAVFLAGRFEPRFGRVLGGLLCVGLLLVPGPSWLFERIALPAPPPAVTGPRPAVMLLSGLPLLWGEAGPAPVPNHAIDRIAAEFRLRPIDTATPATLAAAPLLFAAQPRELSADEIEAIDRWVFMGGRALLLVDPDLRWASALPPGDPRRPPRWATLAPLLARWGVVVGRATGRIATIDVPVESGGFRRIVVDGVGTVGAAGGCVSLAGGHAADCRIGRGRVLILADADLLDDALWVGPGAHGDGPLARAGDNGPLLAAWLDDLAGHPRDRSRDSVAWRPAGSPDWPFAVTFIPGLLAAALSLVGRANKFAR